MRRFGSSFPSSRRVERSRCVCRFSVYGSRKNDWKVEWSENTLAGVTLGQRAEAWIPLHVATAFADAGRRCLATAMHPEMVTNEACNGLCAVCQTGPQRRAHSGRVPGGFAPITMAHCPSAVRAERLREASKMGPGAGLDFSKRPDVSFCRSARSSNLHFRCLGHAMGRTVVGINPHEQCTAVRVPEPGRHGRNVHASLDCGRCEGVPQIMVC